MAIFHASNNAEVGSNYTIEADLDAGNRRLIVTSGIVLWNWVLHDDNTHHDVATVYLNVFARDLEQASAFVALASIMNDDTGFTIATDTAKVELDPNTGELVLSVNASLSGDSALNRFSYQVVATVVSIESSIYGTITWSPALYVPLTLSTIAAELFVVANKHEMIPSSGGFASTEQLTPILPGRIEKFTANENYCVASYRIINPPKAMPLKVTVSVAPSFAGGTKVHANRTSGPDVFTLTLKEPDAGVDFEILKSDTPK